MAKKKVTNNERAKLFERVISKGDFKGDIVGRTIGFAFCHSGGYLTGNDIVTLTNISVFGELNRMKLIERYEKTNELSQREKSNMTRMELKAYDRENTVYIIKNKLVKMYRERVDNKANFAKGNSVKHALIQRSVFLSSSLEIKNNFMNEKDLAKLYKDKLTELRERSQNLDIQQNQRIEALNQLEKLNDMRSRKEIQLVDFAYKDESGDIYFGEAITANYTSADKMAKVEFVKALGYSESRLTFYK